MGASDDNQSGYDFKIKHISRRGDTLTARISVFELYLLELKTKLEIAKREKIAVTLPMGLPNSDQLFAGSIETTSQVILIQQIKVVEDAIDETRRELRRLNENITQENIKLIRA